MDGRIGRMEILFNIGTVVPSLSTLPAPVWSNKKVGLRLL